MPIKTSQGVEKTEEYANGKKSEPAPRMPDIAVIAVVKKMGGLGEGSTRRLVDSFALSHFVVVDQQF